MGRNVNSVSQNVGTEILNHGQQPKKLKAKIYDSFEIFTSLKNFIIGDSKQTL